MTDISETLAPNSEQLDAIDLVDGPQTFTVERVVVKAKADQPVDVHLVEFPRVWRPGKNMRRVLAYCWGKDSSQWVGKRVRLYLDPEVKFGNEKPGGTRISHLSGIDGPKVAPIIITKGKSGTWKVDPLPDAAPSAPASPMERMGTLMKARGLTVKEDALAYVESIIGRAVASRDEMTSDEVAQVNAALEKPISEPS